MTAPSGGRLAGRVALITGASRGIGAAVAQGFAAEGAHVVLVARTTGGLEEVDDVIRRAAEARGDADRPPATLVPLDLREFDAIDRLGGALYERFGRLDILVGNAGILGPLTPVGHIKPHDWDDVIAINLTANYRLIRSMDPLLRAAPAGRAIFVTSGAAHGAHAYWGAYAASKAGLEQLVTVYNAEIQQTSVRAHILNPGVVRTRMRAQAFPGEKPESLAAPETLVPRFLELALS